MEENKRTEQEAKELDLEKMEQVSGGVGVQNGYAYCSYCKKETKWENGMCTEPKHRARLESLFMPAQHA